MIYETIFKKLDKLGVIDLIKNDKEAAKAQSSGFMDLGFDRLVNDPSGAAIIALHHYYVQMGDMMADPDMQIRVFLDTTILDTAMAEAMTYQQDSLGIYQEVYPEPDKVNMKLKGQLNRFLLTWLNNLLNQGFSFQEK